MSTTTKSVTWTGRGGQSLVATIRVNRDLTPRIVDLDGQLVTTSEIDTIDETSIIIHMDGVQVASGSHIAPPCPGTLADVAGIVGGKVTLRIAQVEAINQAIADATAEATTPEFVAHIAAVKVAQDAADKAAAEYDEHTRRVDNMMTLGGRTY